MLQDITEVVIHIAQGPYIPYALLFSRGLFCGFKFAVAVVFKYSRIYGMSPYAIIVCGGCIGAKLAGLVVGFV